MGVNAAPLVKVAKESRKKRDSSGKGKEEVAVGDDDAGEKEHILPEVTPAERAAIKAGKKRAPEPMPDPSTSTGAAPKKQKTEVVVGCVTRAAKSKSEGGSGSNAMKVINAVPEARGVTTRHGARQLKLEAEELEEQEDELEIEGKALAEIVPTPDTSPEEKALYMERFLKWEEAVASQSVPEFEVETAYPVALAEMILRKTTDYGAYCYNMNEAQRKEATLPAWEKLAEESPIEAVKRREKELKFESEALEVAATLLGFHVLKTEQFSPCAVKKSTILELQSSLMKVAADDAAYKQRLLAKKVRGTTGKRRASSAGGRTHKVGKLSGCSTAPATLMASGAQDTTESVVSSEGGASAVVSSITSTRANNASGTPEVIASDGLGTIETAVASAEGVSARADVRSVSVANDGTQVVAAKESKDGAGAKDPSSVYKQDSVRETPCERIVGDASGSDGGIEGEPLNTVPVAESTTSEGSASFTIQSTSGGATSAPPLLSAVQGTSGGGSSSNANPSVSAEAPARNAAADRNRRSGDCRGKNRSRNLVCKGTSGRANPAGKNDE